MDRKQFTFYLSFYQSIRMIRDKRARADAYDAICAYALCGVEPDLEKMNPAAAITFVAAKPNLRASRQKAARGTWRDDKNTDGEVPEPDSEIPGRPRSDVVQISTTSGADTDQIPVTYASDTVNKKEKENEEEVEIEKENECYTPPLSPSAAEKAQKQKVSIRALADLYREMCPSLPDCRVLTNDIRRDMVERWKQYPDIAVFRDLFRKAEQSDFLTGRKGSFKANLAWLMEAENFANTLNGKYDWSKQTPPPSGASGELGEAELEAIRQIMEGAL